MARLQTLGAPGGEYGAYANVVVTTAPDSHYRVLVFEEL
jgi:hypothetical protein